MQPNTVLIIAGPTASGKSSLAIAVAKQFNGVIINCDSMQIYKDIPIIAATPTAEEKQQAEHRLYELYDCSKRGNVVEWLDLCVTEIQNLWQEKCLPIVVGGTGMYIDALINGITPIPEVPTVTREKIATRLQVEGLASLYRKLQTQDMEIASKLSPNDKTRILRALEIIDFTHIKVSEWYKKPLIKKLSQAYFKVVKIVPSLDEIEQRCRQRLDNMIYNQGALKEVTMLLSKNIADNMPAMKALGVPELRSFILGKCSLEEAMENAKLHTRQYAKRQRTWLKNKLPADIELTEPYLGQNEYIAQIEHLLNL